MKTLPEELKFLEFKAEDFPPPTSYAASIANYKKHCADKANALLAERIGEWWKLYGGRHHQSFWTNEKKEYETHSGVLIGIRKI